MDLDLTLALTLILTLTLACLLLSLRSSSSKLAQLTLEQILEHLDNLRLSLSNTKNNCETNAHTHTIHTSTHTISNGDDVCLSVCQSSLRHPSFRLCNTFKPAATKPTR